MRPSARPFRVAGVGATLAVALLAGSLLAGTMLGRGDHQWAEGATHHGWTTVFTGYGTVGGDQSHITLDPRAADAAGATHGALVVSREQFGDLRTQATITTLAQHRTDRPNPWEVGWFLWHYTDRSAFYAVVVKPTGWEISKQDPAYPGAQRFLASGTTPTFPVGVAHTVVVTQRGATFTVTADGRQLATVTDTERPYRRGAVGLYSEDAKAVFTNLITAGDSI